MQSVLIGDRQLWPLYNGLQLITPKSFHKITLPQAGCDHRKWVKYILKANIRLLKKTCPKSFKSPRDFAYHIMSGLQYL